MMDLEAGADETINDVVRVSDELDLLGFQVLWIFDGEGFILSIHKKRPKIRKSWRARIRELFNLFTV